mgnify:CR=1 FL=1
MTWLCLGCNTTIKNRKEIYKHAEVCGGSLEGDLIDD